MQRMAILIIRFYRCFISPFLGPCCRFYPCCSRYAEAAIRKHGVCRGGVMAIWRICRCHPYSPGGFDPVK